jgi:precorrin-3B synthase
VHEAADGLLARVRLPGGAVSAAQLRELSACAADLGSGVIELTSRANIQVRGLGPASASAFAERIAAAGLLPSTAHERVRNIVASPFSGRGPAGLLDTQPLVEALDRALCGRPRLADLPGRFLFAVDDGTGDVANLGADITFAARTPAGLGPEATSAAGKPAGLRSAVTSATEDTAGLGLEIARAAGGVLLLAGVDVGLDVAAGEAVALMIAAAEAFLDERDELHGRAWRIGELPDGPARIAARLRGLFGIRPPTPPHTPAPPHARTTAAQYAGTILSPRAGVIGQRDGRVALEVVVPLGRLSAAQAGALADVAGSVRLTPWRTVVLLDLAPAGADRAAALLGAAGLVTDPASPWVGVTACTGRPGCAKALSDVQEDARRWVADQENAPETPVHWAGCERRCGLPRGRVVQMVADGDGYHQPAATGDTGPQTAIIRDGDEGRQQ